MTIREWLTANADKYKDKSSLYDACMKATGATRESIIKKASKAMRQQATTKAVTLAAGPKKGIPVAAFLHKLDFPAQLSAAIKEHCADCFLSEQEFRALTKLNANSFRQAVNTGAFAGNQIKIDGIVYWSTEANVKKANEKKGMV